MAVLAPIIMTAGAAAYTIDTWWDLTMGRLMVADGRPLVDTVLSFAPATPGSVHGQWLAHVLLYASYALGGDTGLRLFSGGIAALTFGLLVLTGQMLGGSARTSALGALLAGFITANNLGLRAQLFSYLMLALVYLLLVLRHRHPRSLYALPLVFTAWANLHGAFLIGLALVGLHAADATLDGLAASWRGQRYWWREPATLWTVLAVSILAAALNPLGLTVYTYVWSIASYASSKTLIPEWQPTTIQDFTGQALAAASLLAAVVLWRSRRPVRRLDILTLLGFGLVALTSQRQVVWWGLLACPILASYAAALPRPGCLQPPTPLPALAHGGVTSAQPMFAPRSGSAQPMFAPRSGKGVGGSSSQLNWLLAGLLTVVALGSPVWRPAFAAQVDGGASSALSTPARLAEVASMLPDGARMFVFQPWTGYFAWRLWPHQQSMIDARFETHPTWVWDDYQAVSVGRADWEQILGRYQVDYLVLHADQQALLSHLAEQSGHWSLIYRDEVGAILQKRALDTP